MRTALAIAAVLLVLVTASAPHSHGGALGTHGCVACLAAACDQAANETPEPARPPMERVERLADVCAIRVAGVPLGSKPGQSPPHTSS